MSLLERMQKADQVLNQSPPREPSEVFDRKIELVKCQLLEEILGELRDKRQPLDPDLLRSRRIDDLDPDLEITSSLAESVLSFHNSKEITEQQIEFTKDHLDYLTKSLNADDYNLYELRDASRNAINSLKRLVEMIKERQTYKP